MALHSYYGNYRRFPPAAMLRQAERDLSVSWRVYILPGVEEVELYEQIKPKSDGGTVSTVPDSLAISVYWCPSAQLSARGDSNYYGVAGAVRNEEWMDLEDSICGDICTNGMFFPESRTTIGKIEDGTSHTLAIGERTYILNSWMTGAVWVKTKPKRICMYSSSNLRYPINASHNEFGYHKSDMEAPPAATKKMLTNDLKFGSNHPGGAQFCYADGSVHMLLETMDFTLLENMATIAGHETDRVTP
jgi:prepilin-type processing-associated H-X9-DG protein